MNNPIGGPFPTGGPLFGMPSGSSQKGDLNRSLIEGLEKLVAEQTLGKEKVSPNLTEMTQKTKETAAEMLNKADVASGILGILPAGSRPESTTTLLGAGIALAILSERKKTSFE